MNIADSERLAGVLEAAGYRLATSLLLLYHRWWACRLPHKKRYPRGCWVTNLKRFRQGCTIFSRMVPQEKRKHQDFLWLSKNMKKLQEKYAGKVVAIVNKHISIGRNAIEAYNKSKKHYPGQEPLMASVPSKECLLL